MILRKPYVLFIKLFKPMHIFMSVLIALLIYNTNKILTFFSNYIYSDSNVVGQSFKNDLVNNLLFIIPIILIIFSLIFFGIMFRKKKNVLLYFINVFCNIVILIINIYCSNFLGVMEENVISIKLVKLNHDLIFINMIIEVVLFIALLIRGLGFDFKKFNFGSDISKLDINEIDKEEIEVNINIDFDDKKRERRKKIRHLKYLYYENKTIINIAVIGFVFLISIITIVVIVNKEKLNVEGTIYNIGKFNLKVDETFLMTDNYKGKKITEDYLIVTKISLQTNIKSFTLFLDDFSLKIGDSIFKPNIEYANELIDIGVMYKESILQSTYDNFILIFEIPEKYIESDMILGYNNEGYETLIKLNPKKYISKEINESNKMNELLSFKSPFEGITLQIKKFDINKSYKINYNYCIKDNDCLPSIEYLKPTLNENFDKVLLMLEYEYKNNSNFESNTFYDFFGKFGAIYYKKGDKWYSQNSSFEQIKSKKTSNKNTVYIGVNEKIMDSDSIKIVFKIRDSKYEYILK